MPDYIAAIDQGTTSTRCLIIDPQGKCVGESQLPHQQFFPKPGWVEHDATEIWTHTQTTIKQALAAAHITGNEIAGIGLTNQRETTVVWDKRTGKPYAPAIVWQDTRTDTLCGKFAGNAGQDRYRALTGLPLSTYFSGPKIRWLLDSVDGLQTAAEQGQALFGTMECWLIWQLTGGPHGGVHITDVTNASRTLLMDLHSLQWSDTLLETFNIPRAMLPTIRPSSDPNYYGLTQKDGPFGAQIPLCAALGDQQAAMVGQACFDPGDIKNTYGTGCFMLLNTGTDCLQSKHGLLTTVCYQFADAEPVYALEGSVAMAGALVQWLRDNLGLIHDSADIEALAASVPDNGDVYFVPAFSGLYAPYWRADARGLIIGMTRHTNRGHIARAALEATAYQTREIFELMRQDSGFDFTQLKVDGGMVQNELLMQFQADVLGVPVVRPPLAEITALGAAYAAGLAVGFWPNLDTLRQHWQAEHLWQPARDDTARTAYYHRWQEAVTRTLNWHDNK